MSLQRNLRVIVIGGPSNAGKSTLAQSLLRWQKAVHQPGIYDLEVDTSVLSPEECANVIRQHLQTGPAPMAFQRLVKMAVNDAEE